MTSNIHIAAYKKELEQIKELVKEKLMTNHIYHNYIFDSTGLCKELVGIDISVDRIDRNALKKYDNCLIKYHNLRLQLKQDL